MAAEQKDLDSQGPRECPRTDNALRASERRFRTLANHAPVGLFQTNSAGDCLYVNQCWCAIAGMTYEEALGRGWIRALHPEDKDRVFHEWYSAAQRGQDFHSEYRFKSPDGRVTWLQGRAATICDDQGQSIGFLGTIADISERKRAEDTVRSLLRISERLSASLDEDVLLDVLVQEAIRLVEAESGVAGTCTSQGMVCRKYFQRGKVIPLEYCWPPMHGLPGWLMVHKIPYVTNDASTDTQIVHSLCEQFGVRSALSTPILNARGEVLGFFEIHNKQGGFTATDQEKVLAVSHAASIAIENARLYQAARQSDRRKDEFLAMLAHELRNPLAPIRTGLDLLALETHHDHEIIGLMQKQLQHVVRLVDDLLDVSRIMRGKIVLRKEAVELVGLVQGSIDALRTQAEARQQVLVATLPEESIWLNADPVRLVQVVENLLGNAIKYTDIGGRIEVTVERQQEDAVLTVRDTGIGIEPEFLESVFELFAQSNRSLDRAQGGLGIGLTLVQRLLELHGGIVSAHSPGLGLGSTFVVRLPTMSQRPPSVSASTTRPAPRGCSVLVVDDNEDAARMLSLLLARLGNRNVEVAHDGLSALQKIHAMQPDVVLLDIGLPGMDGYAVARSVRQLPQFDHMLLVAVTGYGQKEDHERSRNAGFDRHFVKPVDAAELQELLADCSRPSNA